MIVKLNFGQALAYLKRGACISRAGWNGKGMWLMLITNWTVAVSYAERVEGLFPAPFIGMRTADRNFVPWLASQTDILAEDWVVHE